MADYNDEKTVIVDRDATDRSSPLGWIIVAVLLLVATLFFVMNYLGDGDDTTDTNDNPDSSIQESTLPADNVIPTPGDDTTSDDTAAPNDTDMTNPQP